LFTFFLKYGYTGTMSNTPSRGFTLIEIIVVVAIIGILSSLLMANFLGARERARDATRKSDIAQIQSALEVFRSDHGYYPPSTGSNIRLDRCGAGENLVGIGPNAITYMTDIPCNPAGTEVVSEAYKYESNSCDASPNEYRCYGYTLSAQLENKNDGQAKLNPAGKPIYSLTNP
jgi:type II secretion system protein G